ncbi:MAG: hypothetical protein ABFS45_23300 [Pseudomonadota bacterium]
MKRRQAGFTQEVSAAKTGISVRSGRRIEKGERQVTKERHWRTRKDPLEAVWESELIPLLEREPSLTGITLWDYLDEKYPEQYPECLLRTLQRRVKHWQATQGPNKEVMFRQSVPAGHQGLSDFTHPNTAITIAGEPFKHLLYQFRLAYSGWRYVHIVQGGESYSALADGLQNALHKVGGAPKEHRFSQFRDDLLPSPQYRQLWMLAEQQFTPQQACKWMVAVLRFAADYDCEGSLAGELIPPAEHGQLLDLKSLQAKYLQHTQPPAIPVRQHQIADYDRLLSGQWKDQEVSCG